MKAAGPIPALLARLYAPRYAEFHCTMEIAEKIVLLIIISFVDYYLIRTIIKGAPFAPTNNAAIGRMLRLLNVQEGEKAIDLGSGDGRVVIALARAGAIAHGFEINPVLVWYSRLRIYRAGLKGKAFIHRRSYWKENFGTYTIATVFGIPYIMKPLQEKLMQEMPLGARVASNCFRFPDWHIEESDEKVFLYRRR